MSLKNKVVIITGGSSGIGATTAFKMTADGADVAIVARNRIKLQAVATKCAKYGRIPLIIIADLTKEEDVLKTINITLNQFGKIDVLINNAGFATKTAFDDEAALEVFDSTLSLNLRAVVHLTNLATSHLAKTRGNIVNISSILSMTTMADTWAYCTAKAGIDHFSRCMALELAPKGIRVNVVNPGPVKTDFIQNMGLKDYEEMILETFKSHTALKRVSEPEEVADIIMFLASDKAKGVTGSNWVVDNGYLLV